MTKLDTLAYRLKDLETLRNLFSELNFDFEDGPVSKDGWTDYQKSIVRESKIIASKSDYRIYYIQTDTDSIKQWKDISAKIIKANNGFAMVCSHNPGGIKWVFSSLAKEFSKSFSETRHIPIDIRDDAGIPKTFVEFLAKIRVGDDATASSIMSQMSEAFDSFAIQIHDELTVNVFEALKSISEGIILDKSNGLALDEPTLDEIREPTFILLYRIMFVLYAEDRSVFPDSEYYYDNFSLKWIKQEWILNDAAKIDQHEVQNRLRKLFRLIEVGSEELDYKKEKFFMRSYYGRLFDRKIHHQLEKWNIPNENLLKAIDLLTRTRDRKGNYFFLDYAALETRHLGAIYEHLLEFHLTIKDGKVADLPNPKERKSTGSYYTPKYIVDYIVENTVGPLIDNIVKDTSDSGEQIDKILALNVLDPAMGSGHFLVGVTNYIAKRICLIEYGEKDTTEHAFVERKRDVARRCIYGVDINPLAVDLAQVSLWLETLSSERPLSFLSAHLKTGNSLIGSSISDILDKQTTIVEATTGRDQFKKNIRDFIMLEMLDDDTPEAVRAKSVKYSGMQSKGTFYHDLKFLLDAKIAKDFGVDVPPIGDFVAKIGQNSLDFFAENSTWPEVKRIAEEHSFFHWDLEFPDIFYNEDGKRKKNIGFDAVVGNPPYVRAQRMNKKPRDYFTENYSTATSTYDMYSMFVEVGLERLSRNGHLCFILPHKFFTGMAGKTLRVHISSKKAVKEIIHFGTNQVFEKATTYTCILTLSGHPNNIFYYKSFKLGGHFTNLTKLDFRKMSHVVLGKDDWNFNTDNTSRIIDKIRCQGHVFKDITNRLFKGSSTGNDAVFVLEQAKQQGKITSAFSKASSEIINIETKILRHFVHGEDVKPYRPQQTSKMLIFPYSKNRNGKWEFIPLQELGKKYPKAFTYLQSHRKTLMGRKCKLKKDEFYRYSAARSLNFYPQPKIMIPDMLVSNRIGMDVSGVLYHNANIHSVDFNQKVDGNDPYFYLGVLNSKLFWFFIKNTTTSIRGDAYRLTPQFLRSFAFPVITDENKIECNLIATNTKEIIRLMGNAETIKLESDRNVINKEIINIEKENNSLVCKIYGLNINEIED